MQPPNLCYHFQRGFCSYGSNCRFLHQQVGAYARGGGRSGGGARFAQGRGERGGPASGGQYSYYQESFFQISTSTRIAATPRSPPAREWSTPLNVGDTGRGPSLNFRFMSWNILAAELAHSHAAELYPQAHHSSLEWRRRLAAVVSHVAAQRPDVLCLQEVDDWPGLRKELGALGYDGVHVQRTGGRGDGCATLWLRDRLRLAGAARPKSGPAAEPGSGSELGAKSSESGSRGVHKIRMADHGLKDNVALLVHLLPRRGAGSGGSGGSSSVGVSGRGGASSNARPDDSSDSRSNASSGSSIDDDAEEGGGGGGGGSQAQPSSQGRRTKRGRQSCEDDDGGAAAASEDEAAAATAAIASLRPYPRSGGARSGAAGSGDRGDAADRESPARQPHPAAAAGGGGGGSLRLPKHARCGFWVANTHVLFNTKRGDIKLGQLRVILSELAARASTEEAGAAAAPAAAVPVVFAGDFNAAPGSGLYRFLRYGALALAGEDRRELSGQVEGYGYAQLQRDTQTGRPPRLARWGPGPELRNQPAASAFAASGAGPAAAAASASAAVAAASAAAAAAAAAGAGSSTEEWRRMRQAQQDPQQRQQQQQVQPMARPYSVRWEEEELIHAMGQVAVGNAVAAARAAAAAATVAGAAGHSAGGFSAAAAAASNGQGGFLSGGNGGGNDNGNSSRFRGTQSPYGGGLNGAAAAQWRAVTESAVVRHPLQLRSAYAALDEQEREPLFTTLHARYVGTVDFVWYTPGGGDGAGGGSGGGGSGGGFQLAPVRVLHPPDPMSYPYGMPCADWPSDHVSLVVDFRLS